MRVKMLMPALAAGTVLLLGACGGGSGSTSAANGTTPTTTAPADPSASTSAPAGGQGGGGARLSDPAVQSCLAAKGITLPQGGARGAGNGQAPAAGDTTQTTQAQDTQGTNPEAPANGQGGGGFGGFDQATRQALADCGVTFGGGNGGNGGAGGFRGATNDPAVQQCLSDKGITLPQRGAGAGNGNGGETSGSNATRSTIDANTRQAIQDCMAQAGASTTTAG